MGFKTLLGFLRMKQFSDANSKQQKIRMNPPQFTQEWNRKRKKEKGKKWYMIDPKLFHQGYLGSLACLGYLKSILLLVNNFAII